MRKEWQLRLICKIDPVCKKSCSTCLLDNITKKTQLFALMSVVSSKVSEIWMLVVGEHAGARHLSLCLDATQVPRQSSTE